jgi:ArsR family transcriptional regulator
LAQQHAPLCVCEITDQFELHQPTISHHLRFLREAGLIRSERRGTWAYYAVAPAGIHLLRWSLGLVEEGANHPR